jgi:hypothetical protein
MWSAWRFERVDVIGPTDQIISVVQRVLVLCTVHILVHSIETHE